MKKQLLTKSYALLWFYDIFFCHSNPLEIEKEKKDYDAANEEDSKEDWEKKWPDEDWFELLEHFTTYYTKDYRPIFAKKSGKTLREIRLYEKQILAYQSWESSGRKDAPEQPWYYGLLDLFTLLFGKKEITKTDFLKLFSLNERTFKRYLCTIRTYERGKGKNEFAVAYNAKEKIYKAIPTGFPSPVNKNDNFKVW
jgi:hypothetical protein